MRILSPYGKAVVHELQSVYGFASASAAAHFGVQHLQMSYGFRMVTIEALHIAYGLTMKLVADDQRYYLKFASRDMHAHPEQLFPWLAHLRHHQLPVPEVIRSHDAHWFLSPLATTDYDIVYLMREVPGAPMQALRDAPVRQYAETMARFHQLGRHYPHPVTGSQATWESKWRDRGDLWNALQSAPYVSRTLVLRAMELIEHTRPSPLFATILHGDFRLCHVFFVDDHVSGIVDVDQSTSGERWVDVCYGLLSGADPERGSFLDGAALQVALQTYHRLLPFTSGERAVLPATFAYATLETLRDLLPGVMAGTAGRQDLEATQNLFVKILTTTEEALLGG